MMSIEQLKSRVAQLEGDLKRAQEALFAAEIEASAIKIGQLFKRTATRGHGRNKQEYEERGRVTGYRRGFGGSLQPIIKLIKKDGADGMRMRPIYDTDKWQPLTGAE